MGRAAGIRAVALSAVMFTVLGPLIGCLVFLIALGIPVWEVVMAPAALAGLAAVSYIVGGPAALAAGVAFGVASGPWRSGRAGSLRSGAVLLGALCGILGWGLWILAWEMWDADSKWPAIPFLFAISGLAGSLCGGLLGRRWPR